jgi:hypothetical protein
MGHMKKIWGILAICLLTGLLFAFPGVARAEALTIEAEVGYEGTYLMNHWTPVRIIVENAGRDLEGSLEVLVPSDSRSSVVYATPVVLPNTSSKEYTIYVKIHGLNRSLDIQLLDKNRKLVEEIEIENLNPVSSDNYFLGLVTDDEPSLGYWKERMNGNQLLSRYQPISLNAANFPDRREVLDNFSMLIFNNIETSSFRQEQLEALDYWLENGGVLIIGTGVNGRRTLSGLSGSIVPIVPGEVSELNISEAAPVLEDISGRPVLGSIPLNIMGFKTEEGTVLVPDLVRMYRNGSGVIYVSAFDIGTEPVLSWTGNKMFWENLLYDSLSEQAIRMLQNPYIKLQGSLGIEEILGYIESMELPSIAVVLFLFLLYLAMAGPLNYMVLKKIDKREWSWITIPALSVIFAVVIYGLGYNTKGGDIIMNTVSVVNMDSDSKGGDLTNYVGIFIPRRGDYRIDVDRDALLTLNNQYNRYPNPASGDSSGGAVEARIIQGKPAQIQFDNVNIWTMKTFKMDTQRVDFGSIEADLYYEMGKIKGTVENKTPYPLEDFVVYMENAYTKVGNIAAGEKKNVELSLSLQPQGSYYRNSYYDMIESLYPYPHGTGTERNRETMTRRRLLENLVLNYDAPYTKQYVGEVSKPRLSLDYIAFYEGSLEGSIQVNGRQPDTSIGRGIIKGSISFEIEKEGYINIPPGILNGRLEMDMSRNVDAGRDIVFIQDFRNYAVFSVDLSEYINLQEFKAQIGMHFYSGNGTLLVFDLDQDDYVELTSKSLTIDESNLEQYVDVDGMVYLKAQPLIDHHLEVSLPSVTLEGRVSSNAEN